MQNKLAVIPDIIKGTPTPKLEITTPAVFSPGVTLVELEPGVSGGWKENITYYKVNLLCYIGVISKTRKQQYNSI